MSTRRWVRALLAPAVLLALLVALSHVGAVGWSRSVELITHLGPWQLTLLVLLWGCGLWAHAFVATAALPGLTHRRALRLNLSGSALTNAVPFSGPFVLALKYRMTRSWGLPAEAFAPFTTVCAALSLTVKLTLPVVAFGLLSVTGHTSGGLQWAAAVSVALLVGLLVGMAFLLHSSTALATGARAVQPLVDGAARRLRIGRVPALERGALGTRAQIRSLARYDGRRMLGAAASHAGLQALLFWAALATVGSSVDLAGVLAAFAFGRALTLLALTPGGVGVAELGSAGLLIAFGGDPATVTAGLLVFSTFTYLLPVPLGALCIWHWHRTSRHSPDDRHPARAASTR